MLGKAVVLGGGAWGTTIANLLSKKGEDVTVWTYEEEVVKDFEQNNENSKYLPGVKLSKKLTFTNVLKDAVLNKKVVIVAQPSKYIPSLMKDLRPFVKSDWIVTIITKGLIFSDKVHLLAEYIHTELKISEENIFSLSGPNFAAEISRNLPALSTIAGKDVKMLKELQEYFSTPLFRVYGNTDIIGVQLGGPTKNVIAIAAGMIAAMGLGKNIHAALLTRGSQEMKRLLQAMGAKNETIFGLACLGDLILTCSSSKSRNYWAGVQLAKGVSTEYLIKESGKTIEGIDNLKALITLSKSFNVELPISSMLETIVFGKIDPKKAILELMNRELKFE
ncbi:MAG: NAD(P)H-dependent glycerol-3-phosphate dehydrogenase [Caldisericia bacterium]|nr:NAD(P)H-dependent glycerol-3-phosphate dehydrogenase [Caldisericia bacterium]